MILSYKNPLKLSQYIELFHSRNNVSGRIFFMNPRYKTNKKWTEFPADLNKSIKDIFKQNFAQSLGENTEVKVQGRVYSQEILLRVGLQKKGELRNTNFEVSLDHGNEESKVLETISIAVDAVASLMMDYFENNEDLELPFTWTEFPFNGKKVWLQYSSTNPDLEAEANKLLGITGDEDDALLKDLENQRSEDALDASEEEFDELVNQLEPQMFKTSGGKKRKDDLH